MISAHEPGPRAARRGGRGPGRANRDRTQGHAGGRRRLHAGGGCGGSVALQRAARLAAARARAVGGRCSLPPGAHRMRSRCFARTSERNVANPRSLFGLWKALEAQKKPEAAEARAAFEVGVEERGRDARRRPARRATLTLGALYVAYLAATIVLVLAPGATTAVVVRNTLAGGHRAGVQAAFGAAAANSRPRDAGGSRAVGACSGDGPPCSTPCALAAPAYLAWLGLKSLARAWSDHRIQSDRARSPESRAIRRRRANPASSRDSRSTS